ncbi:hypothetical protein [Pollutibacter soli]|uniref:hypothetical protein n=1 Tax=Pollutibacter soli TaxID=3034157 RepID=UPI003013ADE5
MPDDKVVELNKELADLRQLLSDVIRDGTRFLQTKDICLKIESVLSELEMLTGQRPEKYRQHKV